MLWQLFQRIEPKLIGVYRQVSTPPPPNLRGDRDVEYSWMTARMPPGPGEALEFGCGNSWLGLVAARRGFQVTAINLTPAEWFYRHPALRFAQKDVFDLDVTPSSLDLVINCSTVEHVGLGRYGDNHDADGDLAAMKLLRKLLKPGGTMLLTIPVGQDATFAPLHRIYGPQRLLLLLGGYAVEEKEYWTKDDRNLWVITDERSALAQKPEPSFYGLGCFVLKKPA